MGLQVQGEFMTGIKFRSEGYETGCVLQETVQGVKS